MRRWVVGLTIALGCATGGEDNSPTPALTFAGDGQSTTTAGQSGTNSPVQDGSGVGTTSSGVSGSDTTTAPGTTGVNACPPEPDDDACFTCGKAMCCQYYEPCLLDTVCTCNLDCIRGGTQASMCEQTCGRNDTTTNIVLCAVAMCPDCMGL